MYRSLALYMDWKRLLFSSIQIEGLVLIAYKVCNIELVSVRTQNVSILLCSRIFRDSQRLCDALYHNCTDIQDWIPARPAVRCQHNNRQYLVCLLWQLCRVVSVGFQARRNAESEQKHPIDRDRFFFPFASRSWIIAESRSYCKPITERPTEPGQALSVCGESTEWDL